jgi:glycosyltransferase involved in cell wall biosynthesis
VNGNEPIGGVAGGQPVGRAVVLVGNPAAPYSRGLRVARTLSDAGYDVEIAAVAADGLPEREMDGRVAIRRYSPSGLYRSMAGTYRDPAAVPVKVRSGSLPALARAPLVAAAALRRWLFWPHKVRGWWATLGRELEPADLYHACGSLTVAAALAARRRSPIGPNGRPARVVYDAIDDVIGSNNMVGVPRVLRGWYARRERAWARASDARTTVNDALADRLGRRWRTVPPLAVPNHPDVPSMAAGETCDLIRERLELPETTRIVLFQGRLGPNLGLDEAAEATLLVPDAAFVVIGFGRWAEPSAARDIDPRFAGRHFTLPPVHPDELASWTASADVSIVPLAPVSENQRMSTPNKFWESIIVGTPVVLGPGLPIMEAIVRGHGLGRVASSPAPADLAAAIGELLDRPADERSSERERIAKLARERFSWPATAARYRDLVEATVAAAPDGAPADGTSADGTPATGT